MRCRASPAVAKSNLGRWPSLLAAASLVVDYVLTVAVSLAAGGVPIEVLLDPQRSLVRAVLHYVESLDLETVTVTVLIPAFTPTGERSR